MKCQCGNKSEKNGYCKKCNSILDEAVRIELADDLRTIHGEMWPLVFNKYFEPEQDLPF